MDIDKEEFDTKLKLKMQKIKFNPSTHIDCVMCKFMSNTFELLSLSLLSIIHKSVIPPTTTHTFNYVNYLSCAPFSFDIYLKIYF